MDVELGARAGLHCSGSANNTRRVPCQRYKKLGGQAPGPVGRWNLQGIGGQQRSAGCSPGGPPTNRR
eukprot:5186692-Ditylum_brightwellii.AAC.1